MSDKSRSAREEAATWLVAHRGAPDAWPENSLSGMRAALEAGAAFVEFDVQLSADRVPMVVHDQELKRVTGRSGRVSRLTHYELRQRSIGEPERLGERFHSETMPDLNAMLALLEDWPSVTVFVEIKRASLRRFGRPAVLEPVLSALKNSPNPMVIISFDGPVLEMARSRSALPIGWVFKPWNESARVEAAQLQPDYLFVRVDRVPEDERPFWPGRWQWVVYDVNSLEEAHALRKRGAHLIETDYLPEWLGHAPPG
jgi:glycerophosphoryl diester phosphodiesterase